MKGRLSKYAIPECVVNYHVQQELVQLMFPATAATPLQLTINEDNTIQGTVVQPVRRRGQRLSAKIHLEVAVKHGIPLSRLKRLVTKVRANEILADNIPDEDAEEADGVEVAAVQENADLRQLQPVGQHDHDDHPSLSMDDVADTAITQEPSPPSPPKTAKRAYGDLTPGLNHAINRAARLYDAQQPKKAKSRVQMLITAAAGLEDAAERKEAEEQLKRPLIVQRAANLMSKRKVDKMSSSSDVPQPGRRSILTTCLTPEQLHTFQQDCIRYRWSVAEMQQRLRTAYGVAEIVDNRSATLQTLRWFRQKWQVEAPLKKPDSKDTKRILACQPKNIVRYQVALAATNLALGYLRCSPNGQKFIVQDNVYVIIQDETKLPQEFQLRARGLRMKLATSLGHITLSVAIRYDGKTAVLMPHALVLARETHLEPDVERRIIKLLTIRRVCSRPDGTSQLFTLKPLILYNAKGSMDTNNFSIYLQHLLTEGMPDVEAGAKVRFDIDACGPHTSADIAILLARLEQSDKRFQVNIKLGLPDGTSCWQALDVLGFRNLKSANGFVYDARLLFDHYISELKRRGLEGYPDTTFSLPVLVSICACTLRRVLNADLLQKHVQHQGVLQHVTTCFKDIMKCQAMEQYKAIIRVHGTETFPQWTADHSYESDDYVPSAAELESLALSHIKDVARRQTESTTRKIQPARIWDYPSHTLRESNIDTDHSNRVAAAVLARATHFTLIHQQQVHMYQQVQSEVTALAARSASISQAAQTREDENQALFRKYPVLDLYFTNTPEGRSVLLFELKKDELSALRLALNISKPKKNATTVALIHDIAVKLQAYENDPFGLPLHPDLLKAYPGAAWNTRLDWTSCRGRIEDPKHVCCLATCHLTCTAVAHDPQDHKKLLELNSKFGKSLRPWTLPEEFSPEPTSSLPAPGAQQPLVLQAHPHSNAPHAGFPASASMFPRVIPVEPLVASSTDSAVSHALMDTASDAVPILGVAAPQGASLPMVQQHDTFDATFWS
eukprot:TRINITY_DN12592_c0_g1_i2.p1 TRINITY_DN12592_c0_g1~~TRINITY_DN12592_c0_g1_i2.p1  ORF type:complete len:1013 (+),score=175.61 TRINITY_DN12592_c0_g1_i2:291-3329(+)